MLALQRLWDMEPDTPADVRPLIEASKRYAIEREGYGQDIGAVFEHVTLNVGTIHGGSSTNVVADRAVAEFDSRIPIGLTAAQVDAQITRILAEEGIVATVEPLGFRSEANWTLPSDPVVESLVSTLRDISDPQAEGVLQWASSDARVFRRHGIPVLQYGPAELTTIHGFDERVKAEDVVLAARVYAETTLRYLGTDPEGL